MALLAVIFDVDGVLVASPHERAWREALAGFADPAVHHQILSDPRGRPPRDGRGTGRAGAGSAWRTPQARASIRCEKAGADRSAHRRGQLRGLPGRRALRCRPARGRAAARACLLLEERRRHAAPIAAARRADAAVSLPRRPQRPRSPRGKPDPAIFLSAADALGVPPAQCVVVEDAPAGVRAARAGGMTAIGIARLGDEALLRAAGADLVVTSLDQVDIAALAGGDLRARPDVEAARMHDALQPTKDPGWFIRHDGYNVLTESVVESRFALGNGFLGMRAGSLGKPRTDLAELAGLYCAGPHGRAVTWPACSTRQTPNRRCPHWCLSPTGRACASCSMERCCLAREGKMLAACAARHAPRLAAVELDASHSRRDHRYRPRVAPPVAGGPRGGAAAAAALAGS